MSGQIIIVRGQGFKVREGIIFRNANVWYEICQDVPPLRGRESQKDYTLLIIIIIIIIIIIMMMMLMMRRLKMRRR